MLIIAMEAVLVKHFFPVFEKRKLWKKYSYFPAFFVEKSACSRGMRVAFSWGYCYN